MSDADQQKAKKSRPNELEKTAIELTKGLVKLGANLHNKKSVILANLGTEGKSHLAVHRMSLGNVGNKMGLVPKEWTKMGYTCVYDKTGIVTSIEKEGIVVTGSNLKMACVSWNGYQKSDADMVVFGKSEKVIGSIPRIKQEESMVKVKFNGEEKEVKKWTIIFRKECKSYFTDPTVLKGFLELEMVGLEDMVQVAVALEEVVKNGGYEQPDPDEFVGPGSATIAADTSEFSAKRNLAGLLLGLVLSGQDIETKVAAFVKTPSVALAHAAGFKQLQMTAIFNVSTKCLVKKVKLVSLKEDTLVLMNKVGISQDYWARFDNINEVECYVFTGSLAVKKSNKVQTNPMKFDSMKATHVTQILETICKTNTSRLPTKVAPTADEEDEAIHEELFG